MNLNATNLVWFRDDLRVADHPALDTAMAAGTTIAVYILDERSPGIRPLGRAARWWLHHALDDLRASLGRLGVPLVLRRGAAANILPELLSASGARSIYWNRRYGGPERAVDTHVKELVNASGGTALSFSGTLLQEPWVPLTQDRKPFKVFTPFFNALLRLPMRPALVEPPRQEPTGLLSVHSDELADWDLLPSAPDWSPGLASAWAPGEGPARERLEVVLAEIAANYGDTRDRPDMDGTSRLSPALRWGHLSPVQVWESLSALIHEHPPAAEGARAMMRQLAWRDFCWNLLYHHPDMATENLRTEFDAFEWAWPSGGVPRGSHEAQVNEAFEAWCRGETGFGLVDAGMKQLWETGWMHNRVRMVAASLLVKNLGIHWRVGEQWFWDTLVDADAASNPANWQWVAGCGADASPYFRIFNPELQAKKFDPRGSYVARFAPVAVSAPIVELKESRARALDAYARMKDH
ncbi:cryptochrome/photolyase family protein [Paeniglutamicibacter kerguelensis]|uniref:Deoxyribodipyrimidine photo-lyase n=1 Tax=Paeniglutamicibacter kerguelensis TaxID=254788 RepID=A0ABS4XH26_9MICC|nr:deoxyribodipyrimidine photo-lyase [Paeniglutamicibacter kerguelensis]